MNTQLELPFDPALPEEVHIRVRLRDLARLAATRSLYDPAVHRGWQQYNGRFVMRCPWHRERTPSLIAYPLESERCARWEGSKLFLEYVPGSIRLPHYHCYGCKASGTEAELYAELLAVSREERLLITADAGAEEAIAGTLPF